MSNFMGATPNPLNDCPYWVGDVLVTMSEISPQQRWSWTSWEQITDCMLRAADSTHPAGTTGGAWEVAQTVEQMPAHYHSAFGIGFESRSVDNDQGFTVMRSVGRVDSSGGGLTERSAEAGGNKPMPIVNKYIACYMWKRTG